MVDTVIEIIRLEADEVKNIFPHEESGGWVLSGSFIEGDTIGLLHLSFFRLKPTKKQIREFKKVCRQRKTIMMANAFIEETRKILPPSATIH